MLLCVGIAAASQDVQHNLTIEDRVKAQETIERVYYSHQIGVKRPFDEAVSRKLIAQKVVTYLKQTAALEGLWHTPITKAMLERELARMSRGSRMPDRLRELREALGEDPDVILECLVLPALANRLTRNFFDYDKSI